MRIDTKDFDDEKDEEPVVKKPRLSKFVKWTLISYGSVILSLGGWMYWHYHQTQSWTSASMDGNLAETAPEFVKNTYPVGMVSSINKLSSVKKVLAKIDDNDGIDDSTIDQAKSAYAQSKAILKKYNVTGGESYDNQTNLGLDIDVYELTKSGYTNPQPKKLGDVLGQVVKRNFSTPSDADKTMIKQLNRINQDYMHLNTFVHDYLPKLGQIKDGNIIVPLSVDKSTLKSVQAKIEAWGLDKFPNIQHLLQVLRMSQWQTVLENNQAYYDKKQWQAVEKNFRKLNQSQFISTDDLNTLSDAKDKHLNVKSNKTEPGYTISDASPIDQIFVNGNAVKGSKYINKSASILITIDPAFKANKSKPNDDSDSDDADTDTTTSSSTKKKQSPSDNQKSPSSSQKTNNTKPSTKKNYSPSTNSDTDSDDSDDAFNNAAYNGGN